VLEERHGGTHVISKIPTNVRTEIAAGERYEFVVRRRDIEQFDRTSGKRLGRTGVEPSHDKAQP
jgi:multiple sugar transport system ATP-binding protein